jgi:DNA-binding Lrp family transcriptional regulator
MRANSLSTYWDIKESLSDKRARVLHELKKRAPITRRDLFEAMREDGWSYPGVTARITELCDLGLVEEVGTDESHQQPRAILAPVDPDKFVPREKRKTVRQKYEELYAAASAVVDSGMPDGHGGMRVDRRLYYALAEKIWSEAK